MSLHLDKYGYMDVGGMFASVRFPLDVYVPPAIGSSSGTSTMRPNYSREDTPLLTHDDTSQKLTKPTPTPLPWRQLSILMLLQFAEPMESQVIAPFLPQVS